MLDIRWIRENPEALDRALANRGAQAESANLIALDEKRRAAIARLQELQTRRNAASKEIGQAKAKKDSPRADQLMAEVAAIKDQMTAAEAEEKAALKALEDALSIVPNVPLDDVPVGDETANKEVRKWGEPRRVNWAKEHFDLGEALGQMDFETAAKLSGSRFVVLKQGLARMERALGQFMLDLHTEEHGYTEVQPPLLVGDQTMYGTAQLPKFERDQFMSTEVSVLDDLKTTVREMEEFGRTTLEWANLVVSYKIVPEDSAEQIRKLAVTMHRLHFDRTTIDSAIDRAIEKLEAGETIKKRGGRKAFIDALGLQQPKPLDDKKRLWLIPTAEVPLTNLVRESILSEDELPLRFTALTPCFRSEAGAAGKDTRGMLRQHQFDKVELVSITTPEKSLEEHERMTACAEEVLRQLDLSYRVMLLSTGDMGFGAQKTYDLEVWLPGQRAFREISSCSVCGDFQARRMQARFKGKADKNARLVHTLNGSGVAVGRALIAVMETYQNEDGSITVPDVLRPYMRGVEKIG